MNNYATPFTTSSRTSWQDISGNNNTATLLSASISGSIPVFPAANNRVLQFDGTSSFASMPDGTFTNFGTGSFTFSTWINRSSNGGFIFGSQTYNTFFTYFGFGGAFVYGRGNIGTDGTFSNTNFPMNSWRHIAFVKSNNTMSFYSNGQLMEQQPNTSSYVQGTSTFVIGKNPSSNVTYFQGSMSNYAVYNRALSQAEITQNYNALKSRFGLQ
jgi:hypothetical protein